MHLTQLHIYLIINHKKVFEIFHWKKLTSAVIVENADSWCDWMKHDAIKLNQEAFMFLKSDIYYRDGA